LSDIVQLGVAVGAD